MLICDNEYEVLFGKSGCSLYKYVVSVCHAFPAASTAYNEV